MLFTFLISSMSLLDHKPPSGQTAPGLPHSPLCPGVNHSPARCACLINTCSLLKHWKSKRKHLSWNDFAEKHVPQYLNLLLKTISGLHSSIAFLVTHLIFPHVNFLLPITHTKASNISHFTY